MENKKCRNNKCKRSLPKKYKHRYCENCRNARIKMVKDTGKAALGVVVVVGGTALTVVTRGKINFKK